VVDHPTTLTPIAFDALGESVESLLPAAAHPVVGEDLDQRPPLAVG